MNNLMRLMLLLFIVGYILICLGTSYYYLKLYGELFYGIYYSSLYIGGSLVILSFLIFFKLLNNWNKDK
jgi:hypothetical protein